MESLKTKPKPEQSALEKVRVVVVDDSAVARGMWVRALGRSPLVQVVTSFHDGKSFLDWLRTAGLEKVDVVLLDIEMPGMNGLEVLPQALQFFPKLKVIIASAHSPAGSVTAVKALTLGAADFISKPSSLSPGGALDQVEKELVGKVLHFRSVAKKPPELEAVAQPRQEPAPVPVRGPAVSRFGGGSSDTQVLVIGCSTGGPQALLQFFTQLPKPFPAPILIVQHMPPKFTALLAASIRDTTGHDCREARSGDEVISGRVLLAPGDFHMVVQRNLDAKGFRVELNQNPPENWCRPAVDPLFRSAADCFGSQILALVLTGMGEDGRRGCEQVHAKGGAIYVQDEASSVVWGMPGAVAKAGLARELLPISELVSRATQFFQKRSTGFVAVKQAELK
jgi:two-component system chemotaxis response regulator CheB